MGLSRGAYGFRVSAKILTSSSVEAVTLANNHSEDYYEAGLQDTKKYLIYNECYINKKDQVIPAKDKRLRLNRRLGK